MIATKCALTRHYFGFTRAFLVLGCVMPLCSATTTLGLLMLGFFGGSVLFCFLLQSQAFYTLRSTLNTLRISKSIQHGIFSLLLPRSITNDEQKRRATLLEILMKKTLFYFREPKQSQRINYIVSHADCSALLCYQKKKYFG